MAFRKLGKPVQSDDPDSVREAINRFSTAGKHIEAQTVALAGIFELLAEMSAR